MTRPVSVQRSSTNSRLLIFFIFIFLHQINLLEEAGISVGLKLPSPGASDSNQNSMYHSLDLLLSVCSRKFKQHAQFVICMCQYYLLGKGQGRRKSFCKSALKCLSRECPSLPHCQPLAQADYPLFIECCVWTLTKHN